MVLLVHVCKMKHVVPVTQLGALGLAVKDSTNQTFLRALSTCCGFGASADLDSLKRTSWLLSQATLGMLTRWLSPKPSALNFQPVSQLPSLWTSLCVSKAGTQGHILTNRASFSELSM